MKNNFEDIWQRVKNATEIKNMAKLAETLGISQAAISKAKAKKEFQISWAFRLGQQYGILTEWIMTGEGPKRIEEAAKESVSVGISQPGSDVTPDFFAQLAEWARETSGTEDLQWIEKQIDVCFPAFRMWREEKEAEAKKTTLPTDKVA